MKELEVQLDNFPVNYFYKAVHTYLKKSQVVNRKLSCSSNVVFLKLDLKSSEIETKTNILKHIGRSSFFNAENILNILLSLSIEFSESDIDELKEFDESHHGIYLSIDKLIPRNIQKFQTVTVATFIGKSE